MKKNDYYVGLDIGTSSVGWCVSDKDYKVLKFNGKKMWGSRLFNEAETAATRRTHRSNRRRLERRKCRINLLQEIFSEEISKIDPGFFIRLKESKYHFDDKSLNTDGSIFESKDKDKEFFEKYPTIYHLRAALVNGEKADIRELYLAIHHIVKYRGHFLLNGESIDLSNNLNKDIDNLLDFLIKKIGMSKIEKNEDIIRKIEEEIINKEKNRTEKKDAITSLFPPIYEKSICEVFGLMLGLNCNMKKILGDKINFEEVEKEFASLKFDDKYEEKYHSYEEVYKEYFYMIEICKMIYDTSLLSQILENGKLLSESKVISYEKHAEDLKILKSLLRKHDEMNNLTNDDRLYKKVFRIDKKDGKNYINYSGNSEISSKVDKEVFYDFIKGVFKEIEDCEEKKYILNEIDLERFLPLQRDKTNVYIPYQLQLLELKKILEHASKDYEFLKDKTGEISNVDKIISLMKFRIPYYVGPINNYHTKEKGNGYSWIVKKKKERVLPWNFSEIVDIEASAEKFIDNLLNKCTYLVGCDVLPKNSLLYSEFRLLNEINNIKVDGKKLDADSKSVLFNSFKKNHKKMTENAIKEILRINGKISGKEVITGIDFDIKSDLKSYRDMENILGEGFDHSVAENIILWVTLFNGEKKILESKIKKEYNYISDKQINEIKKLKYKDWGRLSKEFLISIKGNKLNGNETSIIDAMRSESKTLMELLSNQYDYLEKINMYNSKYTKENEEVEYEMLDDLYVSPAVKRSIWQTIRIVEEIKKIMGREPEKIFIEMTRTNKAEKNRTTSRQKKLEALYANIKSEKKLLSEIKGRDSLDFRSKKLYLYYLQKGKCMYSPDTIDIERLFTNDYDIDHIHPRKLKKDDSFDNLVLVKSSENKKKGDVYPIRPSVQKDRKEFWAQLKKEGFISDKKYERLIRTKELTEQELSDFIARQIVETSQSTKAVAEILSRINKSSNIVYVKAENVTEFRNGRNRKVGKEVEFIKFRELNDLHHAKDAYLNIVVGNVYNEKFTNNPINFIKQDNKKVEYSLNQVFNYEVKRNNYIAWNPEKSFNTVEKMMKSNDVQVTKMAIPKTGELFDATIYKAEVAKKDKKGSYFPIKYSDKRLLDVSKYGGYTKVKIAYYDVYEFTLEKETKKEIKSEKIRRLVPIPIHLSNVSQKEKIKYIIKYVEINEKKKVSEYRLLYSKLCEGSLIKMNGYYYYLCGKTNDRIQFKSAAQIIFSDEYVKKFKNINTYLQKKKDNKNMKAELYNLEQDKKINNEDLNTLYDVVVQKKKENFFKKYDKNKEEEFCSKETKLKFEKLSLEEKCKVLIEVLSSVIDAKATYDLKKLDISTCRTTKSMVISKFDEFKVINKSVTGLFSNEVDLLSV